MNRNHIGLVALCAFVLGAAAPAQENSSGASSIDLRHKTQRKWKLKLPREEFTPVGTALRILGSTFKTKMSGTALEIDTDGDGALDVKVDGTQAVVTLRGRDGQYAVRLVEKGGWKYAASGVMAGKLRGTRIRLIDQNNNGRYDDYGKDAMIVGRGKSASFLSRTVNVGGELLSIDVAENGQRIGFRPYAGETGSLTLSCDTKAKVLGAVVRSVDGDHSFDVTHAKDGLRVPTGRYELVCGEIGLGSNRVKFATGRAKPIAVAKDADTSVGWGGPVRAEFAYRRRGGEVGLSPNEVWYYGAAGEQYVSWVPLGKSPKFTIFNRKTGREIAQAYFPGTC